MKFIELVKMMDSRLYEWMLGDIIVTPMDAYTIINHRWPHLMHRWNGVN